jgi:hypothetical protein
MKKIEYIYLSKEYILNGQTLFKISNDYNEEEMKKVLVLYLNRVKSHGRVWGFNNTCLEEIYIKGDIVNFIKENDIENILKLIEIKEINTPKTWPKYSNESPAIYGHMEKRDGNVYKNCTGNIFAIRWNGECWNYCIENYGHRGSFTEEENFTGMLNTGEIIKY